MSPLCEVKLRWWILRWPREVRPEDLAVALRTLAGSRQVPLVLRAEGHAGHVRHLLGAVNQAPVRLLLAAVPGLEAEPVQQVTAAPARVVGLRLSTRQRAIGMSESVQVSRSLLAALASAGPSETVVIEWALLSALQPQAISIAAAATEVESLGDLLRRTWSVPPLEAERRRVSMAM